MTEPVAPSAEQSKAEDQAPITPVEMYGPVAENLGIVPSTLMSLLLAIGRTTNEDASSVLLPFVQLRIESEVEGEPQFETTVTLDNAAFVVADLAGDLRSICEQMRKISTSGIPPEASRLALAHRFALQARDEIQKCLEELEALTSSQAES